MKQRPPTPLLFALVLALAAMPAAAQSESNASRESDPLDPLLTEELLDLVMAQCRAGQAAAARQLAQDIRDQFATTPAIEALLAPALSGACGPQASPRLRELHLVVGWDDNINLGISGSSISFQTPTQTITYQLDDSYRPVRSAYVSAIAIHQHTTASGWTLQAIAGARQLASYSPFNTLGLQLTGRHPLNAGPTPGHITLGWSETWLGGQRYRSAPSLSWQSQPSRGQQGWVLQADAQQHHYTGNAPDARLLQATLTHQSRPAPRTQISWGGGFLRDQALAPRAGGNRQGLHLQANWQHTWQGGLWHVEWSHHQWQSAQAFLPGLIDQRRSNTTTTWTVGYQRPLAQGGLLYTQYQHRNSQDSVLLYTHRSNQLSAGWLLRW